MTRIYDYAHIDCDIDYATSTRQEGGRLRFRADRRTLAFVGLYFALLAGAWIFVPLTWGAVAIAVAVLATSSWQCAVITHNTIHAPIFRSRRLNRWMQVVLTLTYGHPVSSFVPGHNLSHHKFTQTPRDVMRTTKARFHWNLLNLLVFFPSVAIPIVKGERAFIRAMKGKNERWYRQLRVETVALVGASAVLLVLDWKRFLLFWYLPHLAAAWGIVTINYLQHDGCDPDHDFDHSRNFTGRLFGWWTFNNGFHGMHHIRPNLHWSLLREAHERIVHPHIHPALEEPSFVGYCFRAFVWPGRRVTYDGRPVELPEPLPDENWVPRPGERRVAFSMGAEPASGTRGLDTDGGAGRSPVTAIDPTAPPA